jgi:hypothetical protein
MQTPSLPAEHPGSRPLPAASTRPLRSDAGPSSSGGRTGVKGGGLAPRRYAVQTLDARPASRRQSKQRSRTSPIKLNGCYLKAQLEAFAKGTRHNDISEQMRNVARQMTPEERDEAARYFGSREPTQAQ